jgi:hypothetical protein
MGSETEAESSSEGVPGAKFAIGDPVVFLRCETLYAGTVAGIGRGEGGGSAKYSVHVPAIGEVLVFGPYDLHRDDGTAPAIRTPQQLAARRVMELLRSRDCRALPKSARSKIERILKEEVMRESTTAIREW